MLSLQTSTLSGHNMKKASLSGNFKRIKRVLDMSLRARKGVAISNQKFAVLLKTR